MTGKSFIRDLYIVCWVMVFMSVFILGRTAYEEESLPTKLVLYCIGCCVLGGCGIYLFRPQGGDSRPRYRERNAHQMSARAFVRKTAPAKPTQTAKPAPPVDRTPYNTHAPKSDKPVWRNIPGHATLLLDTNVLMCPDENIRSWFGYLLHNAKQRDWRIVVLGAVYEEIMHHLKHGNEYKAKDARLARNRIELMTDELGELMQMQDLSSQAVTPTDAHYADPQLIEYMCTHKRCFLFSFDNDLKIRCKHLIRDKQPKNRVFSEEDFYA